MLSFTNDADDEVMKTGEDRIYLVQLNRVGLGSGGLTTLLG